MKLTTGRGNYGGYHGWAVRALGSLGVSMMVLLAGGCFRHHAAPAAAPQAAPALAPIAAPARLYYDNSGGIQDSMRLVVRDAGTMTNVWQRATSGQATPPPAPGVDFGRDMVLVVGAGRMMPDDQIRVDSVGMRKENADGRVRDILTAYVSTIESCRRFRADAYPLEIVRVRRFDGTVRFAEQRVKPTGCH